MFAAQKTALSPPGACRLHHWPLARPAAALPLRPTISDTLIIGFFDVYAQALTPFEEVVEVVVAMVFEALFSNVSPSTAFGLFLPEMTFDISGTNADKTFFPSSLATGITYCFTRGIATRPIRMANAPNPPDPS